MKFWEMCGAVMASLGGLTTTILIIIKFGGNKIAEMLSKKFEIQLNKELAAYKDNLDKKNYISKAKFDYEFQIYQAILKELHSFSETINLVYPLMDRLTGTFDERYSIYKAWESEFIIAFNSFHRCLEQYSVFIPSENYNRLFGLQEKARSVANKYFKTIKQTESEEIVKDPVRISSDADMAWTNFIIEMERTKEFVRDYISNLVITD